MSRAKEKRIIRKTGLIMAVILLLTGAASILAWGTNGYIDWTFGNWKNAVQDETPGEEPTPQATGYTFTVPEKTAARTFAASSRAVPEGAEAEYQNFISSSGTDKTADDYLAKVTVKNNIDGQTVSAKTANIKFAWVTLTMSQDILKEHGKLILILEDEDIHNLEKCYYDENLSPSEYLMDKTKELLMEIDK